MKLKLKKNNVKKILFGNVFKKDSLLKHVLFYDYDGKLLYSYLNSEFLNLSYLPSLPDRTSENLTCDGWNWTLQEIKDQINNVGCNVYVGATYHTTDDKTHITCKPTETYPYASMCLTPTVANAVTVDWGDGNTDTWASTSQETKSHTYTGVTDSSVYDITISCSSGTYMFSTYITGSQENNKNYVYTDIKPSNKVTSLGYQCFSNCYSLQLLTIPNGVTSLGAYCFYSCYSLQFITTPSTVTSLSDGCFYQCYSLQLLTIPNSVTSLGNSCFMDCSSLQSISIPSGVTSLGDNCFSQCYSFQSITIPNTVTSLGGSCFRFCKSLQSIIIPNTVTSLGGSCFYSSSIQSIVISNSVTSLGDSCFSFCSFLQKIYMKPAIPPTLASTASIQNNENLVIYIPRGTLSAYQSASNWSSYASKMVEYDY